MALKKQATPKRWRSKEAKEIVAAVQRAGGQVERTASGHMKVIGPAGSAIVASAPNTGRAGGRAVHNTLATIRSKTGLEVYRSRSGRGPAGCLNRRNYSGALGRVVVGSQRRRRSLSARDAGSAGVAPNLTSKASSAARAGLRS